MEKKPEVDGKWIEVAGTDIVSRFREVMSSEIAVVTSARIEMSGADREKFVEKFGETLQACGEEIAEMDDEQKSFYVLKRMLLS